MYFQDLIECPECGFHVHELTHVHDLPRGKVLMCEACHEDSEEGSSDDPLE
jgi:hypothetical protein